MPEVMVRGTPVNGLVAFVTRDLAPQQVARVLSQLPPDEAALFNGKVLAHATVPLALVNRYTTLAAGEKGEDVAAFARRAGHAGAEQGTQSVYKFILMLLSGASVLRAAPSMWKRVYVGSTLETEVGNRGGRLTARDFPADLASCGRITGWFEFIAERTVKNARVSHACRCTGAAECSWLFEW
jgi:hypothetical protein